LFVLVEARYRVCLQHANSGEPAVIRVEGSADFNLHSEPGGVELGPKSGRPCRTDSALLLSLREHRQRHSHATEDDLIAFFPRVADAEAVLRF
jgi:hypothetical protein